ncbi:hypothetical protein BDW22DRAFT_1431639 [Trametopsis cervina]|nr:hypothetical protein BDW22DRAFT_1431639 [Trametopsis cervina]
MLFASTALFTATLLRIGVQPTSARPMLGLQERAVYIPAIITPDASTHWAIGRQAAVTWNASTVPSDADPIPWVLLFNTTDYGGPNYVATLASNFPAQTGNVSFTVPEVVPGSYFIMLGEYGHSSYHFAIDATEIPFAPKIDTPNATTVWKIGTEQSVTWDGTVAPEGELIDWIDLYKTSSFGSALYVLTLAQNVPATQGSVSFIVPDVTPEDDYFIMAGIWGDSTTHFVIET